MLKKYYMQVPGTKEELQPLWHSLLRMPFHKKDYEKEFEDLWYKGMRTDWFPCMLMGRYGQLKYENNIVEAEKVKAFHKYPVIKLQIISTCWETKINTNMM